MAKAPAEKKPGGKEPTKDKPEGKAAPAGGKEPKKDKPEGKQATEVGKEPKKDKPEGKQATEGGKETQKDKPEVKSSTEDKPASKPSPPAKGTQGASSTPSSKGQATPGLGKDAFGRPSCAAHGEEEEIECHESHLPFRRDTKVTVPKKDKDKDAKKSGAKAKFAGVDDEKVGKSSAYSKISEYCQNLVRRQVAVEPGAAASALTSGASVATSGASVATSATRRRGRRSFLGHPKMFQLMWRWLPAAGLYVFATAAITAWVSEWGPVVNHIPFYRDREEVAPPKLSEPESPEDPPSDNPSTSGTDS